MSGRLRVLAVLPGVNPSAGAERSFAMTAPGLIQRGISLDLVVFTERQGLVPELERAGVVIHDRSSCTTWWSRARALGEVIAATRPDVVHATLWDAVVPAQIACGRRVPLVVTWAGIATWACPARDVDRWKRSVLRTVDRVLAGWSGTRFHAVTEGVADLNASALGVRRSHVSVVERGRPEPAGLSGAESSELRRQLGLHEDERVVLAVGRLEPVKDHVGLIRAVGRLPDGHPGVRLLIAGRDGSASEAVTAAAEASTAVVSLLGQRDDVPSLLQIADVFVMSSRREGAAGAVIEAMSVGLPIVATDVEGQRGILRHRENALVVPVGDAPALAGAIAELLDDPGLAERLGGAARRTYEERFTLDAAVDGLTAMYHQIAGRGGDGGGEDQNSSRSP